MATERQRRSAGGAGGGRGGDKVAVTVHVDRAIFELLRSIALSHEFAKVAAASRGGRVNPRHRDQSVATVIEHLIERHRDALEAEDRLKLDRGGRKSGSGGRKGA